MSDQPRDDADADRDLKMVSGERLAPVFMSDRHNSTAAWTHVLYASSLLTLSAAALILARKRRSLLDLWLLVTLAAFLIEIVLLGFLGAGVRFSVGWWAGRAFGLVAASVVMLALLAETTGLHARLLDSLLAESQAKDALDDAGSAGGRAGARAEPAAHARWRSFAPGSRTNLAAPWIQVPAPHAGPAWPSWRAAGGNDGRGVPCGNRRAQGDVARLGRGATTPSS